MPKIVYSDGEVVEGIPEKLMERTLACLISGLPCYSVNPIGSEAVDYIHTFNWCWTNLWKGYDQISPGHVPVVEKSKISYPLSNS
ncbi:hypothetical protein MKX03_005310, partial [Papaver bracteatum]